ncbi:MAG: class I SAM-dependent methyltransferase [Gammaproteobacteria bacterium]|nr:class I SAM-dependent methyltransferase [Gammaproteobacteria bacterium]
MDRRQAALAHVKNQASKGDVEAILLALDDFAIHQEFLMNVGPEKGPLLQAKVSALSAGARVLELGCFCGYSAVLIGTALPEGGSLLGIEVDGESVQVARAMVDYAGLNGKVTIQHGSSDEVIPTLAGTFDLVFLDHWKELYKPDLLALESHGLIQPGGVVFADNVGPHFNPEAYLKHVRHSGRYDTEYHSSHIEYRDEEDGVEISVLRQTSFNAL